MSRKPQKYEIVTTEDDVVEIVNVETGERSEQPRRTGRQIHCPAAAWDLYVNGVKQEPCSPFVIVGEPQPEEPASFGMRYNLISLMRAGGDALRKVGDHGGQAYALHEAANNMIGLLNGKETMAEFRSCYTADTAEPIDLDVLFPDPDDEAEEEADEMAGWDGEGPCPKCQGDCCDPEGGCIHG